MGVGKYSPSCPNANKGFAFFDRNAKGDIPPARAADEPYDPELHFADYDPEGFDSYGYSAYDADGDFRGHGAGIDRLGHTEDEYAADHDLFENP